MFVLNAASGLDGAFYARLARLMVNIERGARAYEWAAGSGAEAHPDPAPDFLTVAVPGVTDAAPPVAVSLRPAAGFLYYTPDTDPGRLVAGAKAALAALPSGHLQEYAPVDWTPHATVLARAASPASARRRGFVYGHEPQSCSDPGCAFTWVVAPVAAAVGLCEFRSFDEVNAVVAAVVVTRGSASDADGIVAESVFDEQAPVYDLPPEALGAPRLPASAARAVAALGAGPFALYRGRLYPASVCAGTWWTEPLPPPAPDGAAAAAARLHPEHKCSCCSRPLWGVVLVNTGRPGLYCVWCAGAYPFLQRADHRYAFFLSHRRAAADAYGAEARPLLEASVRSVVRCGRYSYYRVTPADGSPPYDLVAEPPLDAGPQNRRRPVPLCLRVAGVAAPTPCAAVTAIAELADDCGLQAFLDGFVEGELGGFGEDRFGDLGEDGLGGLERAG